MKHLLISNRGLLEVEALTLLGASTKRGDTTKIGRFGSGNKYALAYFLREGMKVTIFSGEQQIRLKLKRKVFRDKEFDVITVNGKETSITTEFGHEWKLWDAVRELYSNAVDEGLVSFGLVNEQPSPSDQEVTKIYIQANPNLLDLMFNIRDFIAEGNEVLFECPEGKIYRKHNNKSCIYYRGIRCYETSKESIFDYDITGYVSLGENRLLQYSWTLPEEIWKLLFKCNDEVLIRSLLNQIQDEKYLENLIDSDFVTVHTSMNEESWSKGVEGMAVAPRVLAEYVKAEDKPKTFMLPSRLYNSLIGLMGNAIKNTSFTLNTKGKPYVEVEPDYTIKEILLRVMTFFEKSKFIIPYPIKVVEYSDKNIMGSITDDGEILLAARSFSKGKQYIANTIVEEYIHIKHQVLDETRAFQDIVINEFLTYMTAQNGYEL